MRGKLRVRYCIETSQDHNLKVIKRGLTVREVISMIGRVIKEDLREVSLKDCYLNHDACFDDYYDSSEQLFVFSKNQTAKVSHTVGASENGSIPSTQPISIPSIPSTSTDSKHNHRIERPFKKGLFKRRSNKLNGIIAYLTRKCGGNVHDRNVVIVTSSELYKDDACYAAKNVADLEKNSYFSSTCCKHSEDIPHRPNNWICYDFKNRKIIPTYYTIRCSNDINLKNWVMETSLDGEKWTEVDRQENNSAMNGAHVTRTFALGKCEECRFIRLVNIGRNWYGHDMLAISAWEVFGTLLE